MEEVTDEPAELVERVAALDIGKASLVCCVRVPHERKPGPRRQEVRTCSTTAPALLRPRLPSSPPTRRLRLPARHHSRPAPAASPRPGQRQLPPWDHVASSHPRNTPQTRGIRRHARITRGELRAS